MNDRKARRRRRSSNGFLDILNGLLTLLVLALLVAGGIALYGASQFYGDGPLTAETTFRVESGSGLSSIGPRLEEQGLISNQYIFQVGSRLSNIEGTIKQGDFRIPAGASMAEILRVLSGGGPICCAFFLSVGWTSWAAMPRLNSDFNFTGEISTLPPEGSVLPGCYDYLPGDT